MDFIGFVVSVLLLLGIGWLVINFWPVLLVLVAVGILIYIISVYESRPNPMRDIQDARGQAERDINKAGDEYRKRVKQVSK